MVNDINIHELVGDSRLERPEWNAGASAFAVDCVEHVTDLNFGLIIALCVGLRDRLEPVLARLDIEIARNHG